MKAVTLSTLEEYKAQNRRFACLTVYDASFAGVLEAAGTEVLLVGDSLGMVLQGHATTVPVTLEHMVYHTSSVARASKSAHLMADMPYLSYATEQDALYTAKALMQAGAHSVKLEGGRAFVPQVRALSQAGVPVCGHVGLTPQSVHAFGGFKIQGKEAAQAQVILEDAQALEAAGARLLVLECVPSTLAARIQKAVSIPVIGIGSGNACDGQVLVLHDLLGISPKLPKFSKDFLTGTTGGVAAAISAYVSAVHDGVFPGLEHSF